LEGRFLFFSLREKVNGSPGKQPFDVNLRMAALCRVGKPLGLKAGEFMLKTH